MTVKLLKTNDRIESVIAPRPLRIFIARLVLVSVVMLVPFPTLTNPIRESPIAMVITNVVSARSGLIKIHAPTRTITKPMNMSMPFSQSGYSSSDIDQFKTICQNEVYVSYSLFLLIRHGL
ncbi:MAG: hypothetical protein ACFFE2_09185 [Candidatus Thorarchaeota archaeon]